MSATPSKKMLDRRGVGQRYGGKHPRTVKRWEAKNLLPPPDAVVLDQPFWSEEKLDEHDRAIVAALNARKAEATA